MFKKKKKEIKFDSYLSQSYSKSSKLPPPIDQFTEIVCI